jgi:hypothetical protein
MIRADPMPTGRSPTMAERYELLRAAMLGAALPADSRAGLTVLLHRGMWAWACVIDRAQQGPIPACSAGPSHLGEPCERRAVVHLLASMAMTITDRRSA